LTSFFFGLLPLIRKVHAGRGQAALVVAGAIFEIALYGIFASCELELLGEDNLPLIVHHLGFEYLIKLLHRLPVCFKCADRFCSLDAAYV
jgi:hypothetical protein